MNTRALRYVFAFFVLATCGLHSRTRISKEPAGNMSTAELANEITNWYNKKGGYPKNDKLNAKLSRISDNDGLIQKIATEMKNKYKNRTPSQIRQHTCLISKWLKTLVCGETDRGKLPPRLETFFRKLLDKHFNWDQIDMSDIKNAEIERAKKGKEWEKKRNEMRWDAADAKRRIMKEKEIERTRDDYWRGW